MPSEASTKAPVQIETIRVPGRTRSQAERNAASTRPALASAYRVPGTTTVSAQASASGPCGSTTAYRVGTPSCRTMLV